MSLTHEDVQRIIALLQNSHFDEMFLEMDGIKLELRRNSAGTVAPTTEPRPLSALSGGAVFPATHSPEEGRAGGAAPTQTAPLPDRTPAALTGTFPTEGLLEIKSPMLGTFYRAPKPGAQPYVQPGSNITPNDPICIIEVMKLMNCIHAGLSGVVEQILVADGELVEFDQVLMRVRPT